MQKTFTLGSLARILLLAHSENYFVLNVFQLEMGIELIGKSSIHTFNIQFKIALIWYFDVCAVFGPSFEFIVF